MLIYVSHPFTGNEEENRMEAMYITAELTESLPGHTFLNPLDAMRAAHVAELSYLQVMEHCLDLLGVCDAIVLTGDWEHSTGCLAEKAFAEGRKIPVFHNLGELENSSLLHKPQEHLYWHNVPIT